MTWTTFPQSQFGDHAPQWDRLQRQTTNTPFLESAFLLPLLQEFGDGTERIAFRRRGPEIDAAAIVCPGKGGMWRTFGPSQLPLCALVSAKHEDAADLLQGLTRALPGLVVGLSVSRVDPRLFSRPQESSVVNTLDYIDTSSIAPQGEWAAFWDARGKNLRQNTRKQRNKLQAEGVEPELETWTDPDQVAKALEHYGALETSGWKGAAGSAIHPDNAQGRFYLKMLSNFCAQGRGRIVVYRFGDKVVSMDLCIDNGPMVVILKTAYDESYSSVSPSTLMRQSEFEQWWNEKRYEQIEFYGKTLEWHTRWTDQTRRLYHINAYRWAAVRHLHEGLKSWLKPKRAPAAPTAPSATPALAAPADPAKPSGALDAAAASKLAKAGKTD